MKRFWALFLVLAGCSGEPVAPDTDILVIGDSILAWNRAVGGSVADRLEKRLGRNVADRAVSGALVLDPEGIPAQFEAGSWDWLVMNGGANDINTLCGCGACDTVIDRLIAEDGKSGALVDIITKARTADARVVYLGAYRAPPKRRSFLGCEDELDEIDARVKTMAARDADIVFVSGKTAVESTNSAHFFIDRLHPSRLGSLRLADLVSRAILRSEGRLSQ